MKKQHVLFSTNGIAMNPTLTHWIAGRFRFRSSLGVGAIQFAYVSVENSPSGCRSAGSDVFHLDSGYQLLAENLPPNYI